VPLFAENKVVPNEIIGYNDLKQVSLELSTNTTSAMTDSEVVKASSLLSAALKKG
jgi:hypothetical protein